MTKEAFNKKKVLFTRKNGLKFKEETSGTFGAQLCMVLKIGHFGKQIRNIRKVLKCGSGEGWRRSVGTMV